jgi:5'-deoxynucleotidase
LSRQEHYKALLHGEEADLESSLVKASDKICAWIKCVEERRTGNTEFKQAEESIHEELSSHPLACVATWLKTYGESFEKSLDELGKMEKEIS